MATSWLDTNSTNLNNNFKPVGTINYVQNRYPGSSNMVPTAQELKEAEVNRKYAKKLSEIQSYYKDYGSNDKASIDLMYNKLLELKDTTDPRRKSAIGSKLSNFLRTTQKSNAPQVTPKLTQKIETQTASQTEKQPTGQPTGGQPTQKQQTQNPPTSKQSSKSNPTNDYNYTMGLISKNPDAINELVNKKAFNLSNPAVAAAITDFYGKQTANAYANKGNNPNSGNVVTDNGSSEQDYDQEFSKIDWDKPTPFHAYEQPLPADQEIAIQKANDYLAKNWLTPGEYASMVAKVLNVSPENMPVSQAGLAAEAANVNQQQSPGVWGAIKNWYDTNVNTPENRAAAAQRYQEQINQISGNYPRY